MRLQIQSLYFGVKGSSCRCPTPFERRASVHKPFVEEETLAEERTTFSKIPLFMAIQIFQHIYLGRAAHALEKYVLLYQYPY